MNNKMSLLDYYRIIPVEQKFVIWTAIVGILIAIFGSVVEVWYGPVTSAGFGIIAADGAFFTAYALWVGNKSPQTEWRKIAATAVLNVWVIITMWAFILATLSAGYTCFGYTLLYIPLYIKVAAAITGMLGVLWPFLNTNKK